METDDQEGWVTGPALETVKALKAFNPGDEIICQHGMSFGIYSGRLDGLVAVVVAGPNDYGMKGTHSEFSDRAVCRAQFTAIPKERQIDPYSGSFHYWFAPWNIKAWRPKKRVG